MLCASLNFSTEAQREDTRRICPHDGRSQAPDAAVHVRMRIARDRHNPRKCIALLDHNLMSYSSSSRVEIDGIVASEAFNIGILFEILLALILYVVIESEDGLSRIVDGGSAYISESVLRPSALQVEKVKVRKSSL